MLRFLATFAAAGLVGSLAAQCQFSTLTDGLAGASCNIGSTGCCAIPSAPAQLGVQLDVATCTLSFEVHQLEGCCGVTVPLRLLAIGVSPAAIPLPQIGAGCTLWLQPTDVFVLTAAPFVVPIPPTLPPLTFFAQGAAVVVDPLIPQVVTTLSAGHALTLQ